MDAEHPVYDAAAQLERTVLAWNRTVLAFAANGVLLIRVGSSSGTWSVVVGAVVLVLTLLAWLITSRTYRRLRHRPHEVIVRLRNRLPMAAGVAFAVGIADVGAILTYR